METTAQELRLQGGGE